MRTRELLRKMDRTLDRIDGHMARGNELMGEIREEHQLNRREHQLNRREHQLNRAAVQNNTRVLREVLLQRQDDRVILERIEQGIQAQTQGLLHVLDELRGGPDSAAEG